MFRLILVSIMLACCAFGTAHAADKGAPSLHDERNAFLMSCRQDTLRQLPGAAEQVAAICDANWEGVRATFPLADAILKLAPAPETAFDAVAVPMRLRVVRWEISPRPGYAASGRLGDIDVDVTRTPPSASFSWFKDGDVIRFDVEGALQVRAAALTMIGCLSYGVAEGSRIYAVSASGKQPFAMTINFREAAVASQSSSYSVNADFSGKFPTLAMLRADGSEWNAECAQ